MSREDADTSAGHGRGSIVAGHGGPLPGVAVPALLGSGRLIRALGSQPDVTVWLSTGTSFGALTEGAKDVYADKLADVDGP